VGARRDEGGFQGAAGALRRDKVEEEEEWEEEEECFFFTGDLEEIPIDSPGGRSS